MKKQVLTILLLGATFFASAQTAISYVAATAGEQTFTVGKQAGDDLQAGIASLTSGESTGSIALNNGFIGLIATTAEVEGVTVLNDGVTGTFTFTLTTDSATSIDTNLTLDIGKRSGVTIDYTVDVTGYPQLSSSFASDGGATGAEGKLIDFGEISLITGTDLTVTLTLTSMTHVESTQVGIFRLENVLLDGPEPVVIVPTPTEISYVAAGDDSQTFTAGTSDDDLDVDIATLTSAETTGSVTSNANFIGLLAASEVVEGVTVLNDGVTGTFIFTLSTDATTAKNVNLSLEFKKRKGIITAGTVTVTGGPSYPTHSFNYASEGSATGVEIKTIDFGTVSIVDTTPLTVTVTLDTMTHVESTQQGVFRLENVTLTESVTLSNDVVNQIEVGVSPNPVSSELNVVANGAIKAVNLYNIAGQLVKTFNGNGSYNVADVASGVYFVNVQTTNGSKTTKVIKK